VVSTIRAVPGQVFIALPCKVLAMRDRTGPVEKIVERLAQPFGKLEPAMPR